MVYFIRISCVVLLLIQTSLTLKAQLPYHETFQHTTTSGLTVSGSAKLTAASGIDAAGQGYLRLTENTTNSVGYVFDQDSFPSRYGLTIDFEFFIWKTGATTTNQADGMTFFLFDASVNAFRPGGTGGSLGYAQYYTTPGLAKGYIGISIDEFGNFSNPSDGGKNGGPGQQRSSIAIRGPGNGLGAAQYVYQTSVVTTNAPHNIAFSGFTQRYPNPTTANYRKLKIILTPGSSLGATTGCTVTVIMYKGGASLTPVTLISNLDYPFAAPAKLQFGLAGSTGSITSYHEIRNLNIEATNTSSLVAAVAGDDNGTVACQGTHALIDITANDHSANTGGSIHKETVDLDPATAGRQTSHTDAGKGTYSVDDNGIVSFDPVNGYTGASTINYTVADNYGSVSNQAAITVTVSSNAAPALTISDPPAVCSPTPIDITSLSWKTSYTAGSAFDYYANLSDAQNGLNNINSSAVGITTNGTYYVRATHNGCSTIRAINAHISDIPTASNAGSDQNFCSSTGGQSTTLLANNPDVGEGAWSQVTGPAAAAIVFPQSPTTSITSMAKGVYVFRWSISNGACAVKTDDVQVSVGIAASAGPAQVIATTHATLAANNASPATGVWTQTAGTAAMITSSSDPASTVTGLHAGGNYTFNWKITNGSCTSNSQVNIIVAATLPLTFLSFEARQESDLILLQWQTTNEVNNEYFEVQRSIDGVNFTVIGKVPAAAGTGTHTYNWRDANTSALSGKIYYRISQVDKDQRSSFSKIAVVSNSLTPGEWSVAPNPFRDHVSFQMIADRPGTAFVQLINTAGIPVVQQSFAVQKGNNTLNLSGLSAYGPGLYIAEILVDGKHYRKKLLK
jgi:hypothetical protein